MRGRPGRDRQSAAGMRLGIRWPVGSRPPVPGGRRRLAPAPRWTGPLMAGRRWPGTGGLRSRHGARLQRWDRPSREAGQAFAGLPGLARAAGRREAAPPAPWWLGPPGREPLAGRQLCRGPRGALISAEPDRPLLATAAGSAGSPKSQAEEPAQGAEGEERPSRRRAESARWSPCSEGGKVTPSMGRARRYQRSEWTGPGAVMQVAWGGGPRRQDWVPPLGACPWRGAPPGLRAPAEARTSPGPSCAAAAKPPPSSQPPRHGRRCPGRRPPAVPR
jgi:hypothetical protein